MHKRKRLRHVDFSRYPYQELDVCIPRRDLVQQVVEQLHIISHAERSASAFKLSDLGLMELGKIKNLVPAILHPYHVVVRDSAICIQERKNKWVELCAADEYASAALNLFDGKKSIAIISRRLAKTTTMDESQCTAYIRGLFLTLVSCGVCQPTNTHL